MKDVEAV
jgi:hypothetical protein